jgi:hypothetical protein
MFIAGEVSEDLLAATKPCRRRGDESLTKNEIRRLSKSLSLVTSTPTNMFRGGTT